MTVSGFHKSHPSDVARISTYSSLRLARVQADGCSSIKHILQSQPANQNSMRRIGWKRKTVEV
jgi:hypothetical protein